MPNPTSTPDGAWLCIRCGTPRTAKVRSWSIDLKCSGCGGMRTRHLLSGVRSGGRLLPNREDDFRESVNAGDVPGWWSDQSLSVELSKLRAIVDSLPADAQG